MESGGKKWMAFKARGGRLCLKLNSTLPDPYLPLPLSVPPRYTRFHIALHLEGLLKYMTRSHPQVSNNSVPMWRSAIICISNRFSVVAKSVGPETALRITALHVDLFLANMAKCCYCLWICPIHLDYRFSLSTNLTLTQKGCWLFHLLHRLLPKPSPPVHPPSQAPS